MPINDQSMKRFLFLIDPWQFLEMALRARFVAFCRQPASPSSLSKTKARVLAGAGFVCYERPFNGPSKRDK